MADSKKIWILFLIFELILECPFRRAAEIYEVLFLKEGHRSEIYYFNYQKNFSLTYLFNVPAAACLIREGGKSSL